MSISVQSLHGRNEGLSFPHDYINQIYYQGFYNLPAVLSSCVDKAWVIHWSWKGKNLICDIYWTINSSGPSQYAKLCVILATTKMSDVVTDRSIMIRYGPCGELPVITSPMKSADTGFHRVNKPTDGLAAVFLTFTPTWNLNQEMGGGGGGHYCHTFSQYADFEQRNSTH